MIKILIAEDDLGSRKFMQQFLKAYGECDMTVDGIETVDAFLLAWDEGEPYDLLCLDIMMPKLDGLKTLKIIRDLENDKHIPAEERVKIVMTTALNEQQTVYDAFDLGCEAFAAKPINQEKLREVLHNLGFDPIE
ncbi:two-component system, chemotaxis family, response regulator CheY [Anoxynatronum buryatiense]|uniref:Stage 0 sporulation protein A homolog n=1 Tax=Anoxynatronum buryatiense TaxID=489973 RepID=A0AA45WTK5_9CLOT|nr:two-component system, chemotaxis family, response regulator CheY [Anoxynatronum buryatiense]